MKALTKKSILASAVLMAASGIAYAAPVTTNIVANSGSGSTGVTVSATVAPILSMDVSSTSLNLGALTSAGYSSQTLDLEIATNAIGGATVTAASANGALVGSGTSHQLNNVDANFAGQSYQIGSVASVDATDLGTLSTRGGLGLTEINNTAAKTVYTVDGPERANGTADAVVTIQAQSDDATPADAYSDVVTLTVSATF